LLAHVLAALSAGKHDAAAESVTVTVEQVMLLLDPSGDAVSCSCLTSPSAVALLALACLRDFCRPSPPLAAMPFWSSSTLFLRFVCQTFLISLSVRPGSCAAIADHLLQRKENSSELQLLKKNAPSAQDSDTTNI
jgi:hypothetical protein